ncbi:hypothetical protein GCM10017559_08260 [Streptosporangium longisporum]|uniref:Uncharacterized protein n=1 Tax=Streptosporangium longisporum TaxID=46187 RepID=A0ABP6KBI9_9ACTN
MNARIYESYEAEWDPDHDVKLWDIRRWGADLDGQMPDPPYGDCVLRLPDGREGRAALSGGRGTTGRWEGQLWGAGPSPTSTPAAEGETR